MTLDGRVIAPEQKVRVAINNFLQVGGDSFKTFTEARFLQTGPMDVEALEAYFKAQGNGRVKATALDRVIRVDQDPR